jgi:drug/metabolite transporter (DMT)-like permease
VTTILVPLVQATLTSSHVTATTWLACAIALSGIAIMSLDNDGGGGSSVALSNEILPGGNIADWTQQLPLSSSLLSSLPSLSSFSSSYFLTTGDVLILAAAVLYSLHVVRLGRWATVTLPLQLVTYKATTELILGLVLLVVLAGIATTSPSASSDTMLMAATDINHSMLWTFLQESGREIVDFFTIVSQRLTAGTLSSSSIQLALAATLWTGIVSTAYTTYAQSFGQGRSGVSPTHANLIYSLQPLATAGIAYFVLGETMGPFGILGGTLIGTAVYVAAATSQSFSSPTPLQGDHDGEAK